jgi:serine phosphatase RsbU (regulator of sigma subunit)
MSAELIPLGHITSGGPQARPFLAAYKMATQGRHRAAYQRATELKDQIDRIQKPADKAQAEIALAEIFRRVGHDHVAASHFFRAASLLAEEKAAEPAGVAHALGVECLIHIGATEKVEKKLSDLGPSSGIWREPSDGLWELAQGHISEARMKLRKLPDLSSSRWAQAWAQLFQVETLLEMGGLVGAEEAWEKTSESVGANARFSDLRLRHLQLGAWLKLAQLWSTKADDEKPDAVRKAEAAVETLATYGQHHPLYKAWAANFRGELALLKKESPDAHFREAAATLEGLPLSLLSARLLSRQVVQTRQADQRFNEKRAEQARGAFLDLGLHGRLGALSTMSAGKGGGSSAGPAAPIRGSMALRKSIAMRLDQNLDALNITEESGLDALIEVSRYLSSILDVDTLLEKVLESVVRVLKAERGVLLAEAGDGFKCVAARGIDSAEVGEGKGEISFGVIREAQKSGEPVLSDNALSDQRFKDRKSVMATDIRSVICSPIRTQKRVLGYLYLDRRVISLPFSQDQEDLLAAFCVQAAVAWENALSFQEIDDLNKGLEKKVMERTVELRESNTQLQDALDEITNTRLKLAEAERDAMEKEMNLAREIQESILPPPDTFKRDGHRYAGTVIPASYTGGDFWGHVDLKDGRSLILIADVTGHGVAASLITAVAKSCLDTLASMGTLSSVSDVLSMMSYAVHESAKGRLLSTAFAALVDPAGKKITFANAGHNMPYLFTPGAKRPSALVSRGVRLGEDPTQGYEAQEKEYAPGDQVVFFTDGIVECARPDGKEYGERRFRKAIQAHADLEPPEMIQKLIEDAEAFCEGVERDDDLTLVILKLD